MAQKEPDQVVFLKAVVNGKIIGSVRGYSVNGTAFIRRVIVHPYFRKRGIGRCLLAEIESAFPEAKRFEALTGNKSERALDQLRKLGYKELKTEPFTPSITWIYMQKERP